MPTICSCLKCWLGITPVSIHQYIKIPKSNNHYMQTKGNDIMLKCERRQEYQYLDYNIILFQELFPYQTVILFSFFFS